MTLDPMIAATPETMTIGAEAEDAVNVGTMTAAEEEVEIMTVVVTAAVVTMTEGIGVVTEVVIVRMVEEEAVVVEGENIVKIVETGGSAEEAGLHKDEYLCEGLLAPTLLIRFSLFLYMLSSIRLRSVCP